ncbi:MAG: arginase family protein, partial [Chitinophagaceae bacterium]
MSGLLLIKNRSDIGAGTRGSDMGIDAMEIAAINAQNDYFHRIPFIDVKTNNESIYIKNTFPFARRIQYVLLQCKRVAKAVKSTLEQHTFPIVLSGDHSSALGTISGIKAYKPQARLGVLWIDAHADLHTPYTSPSGNIHGMPLAAALNVRNKVQEGRYIAAADIRFWNKMK